MSDPQGVPMKAVLAAYRTMLADAQERNAILTAQVNELTGQLLLAQKPAPAPARKSAPPRPAGK